MIEVGNQVRVKKTGEISLVRHIMFFRGKKTYIIGEPAKFYNINEIELFDKQVEREEKLNQLFGNVKK